MSFVNARPGHQRAVHVVQLALGLLLVVGLGPARFARGQSLDSQPSVATPTTQSQPSAPATRELAQRHFDRARQLYLDGDHVGAIQRFRASYAAYPSPNTRLYIARALEYLGRSADAAWAYELTAEEAQAKGQRYAQTWAVARAELQQLEPRIARLRLVLGTPGDGPTSRLAAGVRVEVDSRRLRPRDLQRAIPVQPGGVRVRVTTASGGAVERLVILGLGDQQTVHLALPAPGAAVQRDGDVAAVGRIDAGRQATRSRPNRRQSERRAALLSTRPPRRPLRIGAYVSLASGVVALAGAIVTWRLAQGKFDDLQRGCGDGPCVAGAGFEGTIDDGQRLQTGSNALLGVGIALAAAGATLLIVDLLRERNRSLARRLRAGNLVVSSWR